MGKAGGEPRWDAALALDPGVKLHLYGKRTPSRRPKNGPLTVLDPDPEIALYRAWRRDAPSSPAIAATELHLTVCSNSLDGATMRFAQPGWLWLLVFAAASLVT